VETSTSRNQEGHQRDSREPCASLWNCGDIGIAPAAASGIGGVGCVTTTSYQSRLPDRVCRRHNCPPHLYLEGIRIRRGRTMLDGGCPYVVVNDILGCGGL